VPTEAEHSAATSDLRTVRVTTGGPMLVQGPVRIETPDGATVESDRFMVAVCTCRRSKTYPLCDTSHRTRRRSDERSAERAP
jgi:CDGSH-type Zn-finger protein